MKNAIRMRPGQTSDHMIGHTVDGKQYNFQRLIYSSGEAYRMDPIEFKDMISRTPADRIVFRFAGRDLAAIKEVSSELTEGGKVEFTLL
jgi:hypothetical protein